MKPGKKEWVQGGAALSEGVVKPCWLHTFSRWGNESAPLHIARLHPLSWGNPTYVGSSAPLTLHRAALPVGTVMLCQFCTFSQWATAVFQYLCSFFGQGSPTNGYLSILLALHFIQRPAIPARSISRWRDLLHACYGALLFVLELAPGGLAGYMLQQPCRLTREPE